MMTRFGLLFCLFVVSLPGCGCTAAQKQVAGQIAAAIGVDLAKCSVAAVGGALPALVTELVDSGNKAALEDLLKSTLGQAAGCALSELTQPMPPVAARILPLATPAPALVCPGTRREDKARCLLEDFQKRGLIKPAPAPAAPVPAAPAAPPAAAPPAAAPAAPAH